MGIFDSIGSAVASPIAGITGGILDPITGAVMGDPRDQNEFRDVGRIGSFGAQGRSNRFNALANRASNVQGLGLSNRFRQGQGELIRGLQMTAAGRGPSVAEQQLRMATDRSVAQQQALAQSAAPGNTALAARQAAQQGSQLQSGLAGQSALARAQEAQAAQAQLANVLGQARAQDIGIQQGNQANRLSSLGLSGQLLGQDLQNAQLQQQAQQSMEAARTARFQALLGLPTQREQLIGGITGVLGALPMGGKK